MITSLIQVGHEPTAMTIPLLPLSFPLAYLFFLQLYKLLGGMELNSHAQEYSIPLIARHHVIIKPELLSKSPRQGSLMGCHIIG
jgi:hypothetical protein